MKPSTAEPLFIDTWGWLVLADKRDRANGAAIAERRSRGLVVTSDYVLDETITRVFARMPFARAMAIVSVIREAIVEGELRLEQVTRERFDAAFHLRSKYRDKPGISFTDFTTFVVMKELKIRDVLTADAHFAQAGMGFRRLP